MTSKLKVGFDLDGVLYDFAESLRRYIATIGLTVPSTETQVWNFFKDEWGWTLEEFLKHCNDGADAGFVFCGPTRPNAVEAVKAVKDLGHEVHIVTDRSFGKTPSVSENNTLNWLDEHGIPYDSVTFSADKTCVETDIFIEDKPENYMALWEAGTPTWLVNRPWNKHVDTQFRVTDVIEYPQKVDELAHGMILVS